MALPRHPRTLVRDIVFEIIKNDPVLNVDFLNEKGQLSIFKQRSRNWFRKELPGIAVYSLAENVDDQNTTPKVFQREITIEVQLATRETEPDEEKIDADEFLDSASRRIEFILLKWEGVILDPVTKGRIGPISDFTLTSIQQGLFSVADDTYSGLKMQFSAIIYDDDITNMQNEDFSTPVFTLENELVDLESITAEIETTDGAEIEIDVDLT